jgi:hypothetical protein
MKARMNTGGKHAVLVSSHWKPEFGEILCRPQLILFIFRKAISNTGGKHSSDLLLSVIRVLLTGNP